MSHGTSNLEADIRISDNNKSPLLNRNINFFSFEHSTSSFRKLRL